MIQVSFEIENQKQSNVTWQSKTEDYVALENIQPRTKCVSIPRGM